MGKKNIDEKEWQYKFVLKNNIYKMADFLLEKMGKEIYRRRWGAFPYKTGISMFSICWKIIAFPSLIPF